MAQALSDSIPMLVITGVNEQDGARQGRLHELPDQAALSGTIAKWTHTLNRPEKLAEVLSEAFGKAMTGRRGPVHIQIPTDIMGVEIALPDFQLPQNDKVGIEANQIKEAAKLCRDSKNPLILIGGGCVEADRLIEELATNLDAPVISTINGRGVMAKHALHIPASASLQSIRRYIDAADLVLAMGTEMGPTDYDMYETEPLPPHSNLIRVDIDADQLMKREDVGLRILGDVGEFTAALIAELGSRNKRYPSDGARRALEVRREARAELSEIYQGYVDLVQGIWAVLLEAILVGDSTQLIYAANLYGDVPRPVAWFNSSVGFGTLGYAAPAAIGASLGKPSVPVVCLTGDGGLQFTLAELGSARDCAVNVAFVVWNNNGYQEIETSMLAVNVPPVGVNPSAPDFVKIAEAYGLLGRRVASS